MKPPSKLLTLALALVTPAIAVVKDSLPGVPVGWQFVRDALPSESIILRVALRQSRVDELEQKVLDVSTPGHPSYGQHLRREEVRSYTEPSEVANASVTSWIETRGIPYTVDNDWIKLTTTVHAANALLDTTFAWYENKMGGGPKLRTLAYSVPDDLVEHIDLIQPTTRFGQLGAQRSTVFKQTRLGKIDEEDVTVGSGTSAFLTLAGGSSDAVCGSAVTPACLKTLYNVNYTATPTNNSIAFNSYLNEYARYSDLTAFQSKYVPTAQGQNFTVIMLNGGANDQASNEDSGEANLDIQYILGLSYPIPITEYSTGGLGPLVPTKDQPSQPGSNEPYLEFLQYILAQPDADLPQTLSTSYGEEEQSVPQDYALKVCNMFMQLGARGVSVLFSSGDSGPGGDCVRNTDNATFFGPTFPAGCPYVTSVGATTGSNPERAVSFSSGGFSIYHARPAYQSEMVPKYLDLIGNTYSSFFNASNRGIPDVAAQGSGFAVIDKGFNSMLSGTSASAPTFAGMVALLNAARKSQGQPPLGFLNPFLYNNSAALTDIDTGRSSGCSAQMAVFGIRGAMWNATEGWDPVTGLGTANFPLLLQAAAPGVANA